MRTTSSKSPAPDLREGEARSGSSACAGCRAGPRAACPLGALSGLLPLGNGLPRSWSGPGPGWWMLGRCASAARPRRGSREASSSDMPASPLLSSASSSSRRLCLPCPKLKGSSSGAAAGTWPVQMSGSLDLGAPGWRGGRPKSGGGGRAGASAALGGAGMYIAALGEAPLLSANSLGKDGDGRARWGSGGSGGGAATLMAAPPYLHATPGATAAPAPPPIGRLGRRSAA
mmetsp:Transcript_14352/g.40895  ORF Transcript_14352/g.40895 Transcript_14352/m.40895 type:complete len:230 (+) Transcript_14352:847-1536(+)